MRRLSKEEERHPAIVAMRERIEAQRVATLRRLREDFGVWINFVAPNEHQGRKVWAIGSRVYLDRPARETFHEFLLHVLRGTLGEGWRARQASAKDAHFLLRCFDEYHSWASAHAKIVPPAKGVWSAQPNGWAQYLRSLAWDIATLIHACPGELPDRLVDRLRNNVEYQSARYEIAVAALFARLDCEIEFLDEDDALRGKRRVEFVATHRPSRQQVAVEAKSRRRSGVLNEPGEFDESDALRGDARAVRRLFVQALRKDVADMPYFVFIDVNAPAEPDARDFDRRWQQDVQRWMGRFPEATPEHPDVEGVRLSV